MLAKEFLSSWIFERLDIFKITNVNISKNKIGIKAKIEKFLKIKNKKNKKNINERIRTVFMKTEIIVKEWKIRPIRFTFDGKTYLTPLTDLIKVLWSIALTTELE